jgi:hypothetical protein
MQYSVHYVTSRMVVEHGESSVYIIPIFNVFVETCKSLDDYHFLGNDTVWLL